MKTKVKRPHAKSVENFNRYHFYAEKAVREEQVGNYAEAATHWDLAYLSANEVNKPWAMARRDLCERLVKRPFNKGE